MLTESRGAVILEPARVVGQFDVRVRLAHEIPRAAGENAALRNDAGVTLAFTRANCTTTPTRQDLRAHGQPLVRS